MKKAKPRPKSTIAKVPQFAGWILITKDADADHWHVAWIDVFRTKSGAMDFASQNGWSKPYRAVRGHLAATEPVRGTR